MSPPGSAKRTPALRRPLLHSLQVYRIGHRSAGVTIADHAYGSTLQDSRWHTIVVREKPRRVVFAASSRALAQLEKRVHANGVAPVDQALFVLTLPGHLFIPHAADHALPVDWRTSQRATQAFGNAWLDAGEDLALWVPSVAEPAEDNLLINASHPNVGSITVRVERDPFEFDPRLI